MGRGEKKKKGPAGLAAIKSLQEEGFQVTGFERRSAVGGLWAFSDDPSCTSATMGTRYQMSKFIVGTSLSSKMLRVERWGHGAVC